MNDKIKLFFRNIKNDEKLNHNLRHNIKFVQLIGSVNLR